jgi:hypothetical protein
MLETHHLLTAGMVTSAGPLNPPLLDYIMEIPLLFTRDPRFVTAFIGLSGVAAVWLTFAIAHRSWGLPSAIISSTLFALAPWAIVFTRKIWAPELEPFFATLCLYGLFRLHNGSAWWGALAIGSWLFMCQLHPLAILLVPVVMAALLVNGKDARVIPCLTGAVLGLAPLLPYVIDDARHGWANARGFLAAARQAPTIDGWSPLFAFMNVTSLDTLQLEGIRYNHFTPIEPLFSAFSTITSGGLAAGLALSAAYVVHGFRATRQSIERLHAQQLLLLLGWMWVPVLLTVRHSAPLYQHYFLILFPAPFLLLGYATARFARWIPGIWGKLQTNTIRVRRLVATGLLVFNCAGWIALVASLYAYVPSGKAVGDFGLPLKTTQGIATLARATQTNSGTLWLLADQEVAPMLRYLLRDVRERQDLPPDALVLPPPATPAGYVFDDASAPSVALLKAAGAQTEGLVTYPGGLKMAIGLEWARDRDATTIYTGMHTLSILLKNGVRFLATEAQVTQTRTLHLAYVFRIDQTRPENGSGDVALYTHVVDAAGAMKAQRDGMPYPSRQWEVGQTIVVWYDVPLEGVAPGQYQLRVGMYTRPDIRRIPMVDASGAERDGEFTAGTINVGT